MAPADNKRKRAADDPGSGTDSKKPKMEVKIDNGMCVIGGRPEWTKAASDIKVNRSKGAEEDRRHMLHYDEVLKPITERIATKLLYECHGDKRAAASKLEAAMRRNNRITQIRKASSYEELVKRLMKEVNGAADNLVPGRANTNNAIEVVRGYLRKAREKLVVKLQADGFDLDTMHDSKNMEEYRQCLKRELVRAHESGDSGIIEERNRIHEEAVEMLDECATPEELFELIDDLTYSVTFDLSPNSSRNNTARAFAWQSKMLCNQSEPAADQLEYLLTLLDKPKFPH